MTDTPTLAPAEADANPAASAEHAAIGARIKATVAAHDRGCECRAGAR